MNGHPSVFWLVLEEITARAKCRGPLSTALLTMNRGVASVEMTIRSGKAKITATAKQQQATTAKQQQQKQQQQSNNNSNYKSVWLEDCRIAYSELATVDSRMTRLHGMQSFLPFRYIAFQCVEQEFCRFEALFRNRLLRSCQRWLVNAASGMLSKPATAMSCGIRIPSLCAALSAPNAAKSFRAKTAVAALQLS